MRMFLEEKKRKNNNNNNQEQQKNIYISKEHVFLINKLSMRDTILVSCFFFNLNHHSSIIELIELMNLLLHV
jgi:hypothetical protein